MRHYIIPIFIPHHGCPHQCIFCNQRAITGSSSPPGPGEVKAAIERHLAEISRPYLIEVAFYGGSFTALPVCRQEELLAPAKAALDAGKIHAIRVSTRPDAIDMGVTERLTSFGVSTVELGVQSFDNRVLVAAGRGHTASDAIAAVKAIKQAKIKCGIQLMPGLPGEDWPSLIHTANSTLYSLPDFVRIYPTVVVAQTPLAELFLAGKYRPLTLDAAVSRTAYLKILFDTKAIPVIRMGLQATDELNSEGVILAGPYHPAFGELVESFLFRIMVARFCEDATVKNNREIAIEHHPRDHSKVRGQGGANLKYWDSNYGVQVRLIPKWPHEGEIGIYFRGGCHIFNKLMLL